MAEADEGRADNLLRNFRQFMHAYRKEQRPSRKEHLLREATICMESLDAYLSSGGRLPETWNRMRFQRPTRKALDKKPGQPEVES